MLTRPIQLLPPPPRRRDWLALGAVAGLVLGSAELAAARLLGEAPSGALALVLVAASALLVAVPHGALSLALARALPSGSAMVASAAVWQVAAPRLGGAVARLVHAGPTPPALLGLALTLAAGVLAATLLAALARDVERRRGHRVRPLPVLGLAALGVATVERLAVPTASSRPLAGVVAAGVALLLLLALLGQALATPGRARGFAATPALVLATLLALGLVWAPALRPLLAFEAAEPLPRLSRPGLVLVEVPDDGVPFREGLASETLAHLAASGLRLPELAPADAGDPWALPDGSGLFERLRRRGYATAAALRAPADPPEGIERLRADPGPAAWLRRERLAMAGRPPLAALSPAARPSWLAGEVRRPEAPVADAVGWLLDWRRSRAPAPFALYVDLRPPAGDPAEGPDAIEHALATLHDALAEQGLLDVTVVAVFESPRGAMGSGFVRPAEAAGGSGPEASAAPVTRRDVAAMLLEMTDAGRAWPTPTREVATPMGGGGVPGGAR